MDVNDCLERVEIQIDSLASFVAVVNARKSPEMTFPRPAIVLLERSSASGQLKL